MNLFNLWPLIAGTGSLVFAIYQFLRTKVLVDRGLTATGTVIEQKSRGGRDVRKSFLVCYRHACCGSGRNH